MDNKKRPIEELPLKLDLSDLSVEIPNAYEQPGMPKDARTFFAAATVGRRQMVDEAMAERGYYRDETRTN